MLEQSLADRTAHRQTVLRLVPRSGRNVNHDTVDMLRQLLREAEAGELVGVAWVGMYAGRQWDFQACGEVRRDPAWTAGMLQAFSANLTADINRQ
jgi:hypothetical protein